MNVVKDGVRLPAPFITLDVDTQGERGAVGLAFDPKFAENGWVYINFTAKTPSVHQRVSRFTADGDVAVPGSEQVIWDFEPVRNNNHVSGATAFGPDGKLYVAQGDNGVQDQAQRLDNQFGKVIRINPDGTIPVDNPFYATATGKNRAIWALGLRNPFSFEFQPVTGRFSINDVGQNAWEEINEGAPGANYGWPVTEGATTDPRFRAPATFPAEFVGTTCSPISARAGSGDSTRRPARAPTSPAGSGGSSTSKSRPAVTSTSWATEDRTASPPSCGSPSPARPPFGNSGHGRLSAGVARAARLTTSPDAGPRR